MPHPLNPPWPHPHPGIFLKDQRVKIFHSLKLCREEVETIVQVALCGHFLQVGVAVLVLVCQVIGHQKSWRNSFRKKGQFDDFRVLQSIVQSVCAIIKEGPVLL